LVARNGQTLGSLQQTPQRTHWPFRFLATGKRLVTERLTFAVMLFFEKNFFSISTIMDIVMQYNNFLDLCNKRIKITVLYLYKKRLAMAKNDDFDQIIAGCKKGMPECFSQLLDMYSSRCYGYFYRLTGSRDTSDELLSELFVKLVEKIGSFKDGCFESWLFKIASNIFYDHLRDKHKQKKLIAKQKE
jgi:hypothetical protein